VENDGEQVGQLQRHTRRVWKNECLLTLMSCRVPA
jgi:hypothetical protein